MTDPTNPSMSDQPSQVSLREAIETMLIQAVPHDKYGKYVNEARNMVPKIMQLFTATIAEEVRLARLDEASKVFDYINPVYDAGDVNKMWQAAKDRVSELEALSAPSDSEQL